MINENAKAFVYCKKMTTVRSWPHLMLSVLPTLPCRLHCQSNKHKIILQVRTILMNLSSNYRFLVGGQEGNVSAGALCRLTH